MVSMSLATTLIAITSATAGPGSFCISAGEVIAPEGTVSLSVADAAGRIVRSSDGSAVDISQLRGGVYIVTATAADGSKTAVKVAR